MPAKDCLTPEQAATTLKGFCSVMNSEGELELKRTHTYSYQVQGFLAITCNMLFCYIDNQQTQHPDHPSRS